MRWLVFSDTHLGSATCKRQKDLLKLLNELAPEFDILVINGDFIDLWRSSLRKINRNSDNRILIDYIFNTLSKQKKIIYILGNHEDTDEQLLQDTFPQIEMFCKWEHYGILVTHGHQFHYTTEWKRFRGLITAKIRQVIESLFKIDLREVGMKIEDFFNLGWSDKLIESVHDEAVAQLKERYKGAVIGHTHTHCQRIFNIHSENFTLYDCGNTYKDLNYFIFDKSTLVSVG